MKQYGPEYWDKHGLYRAPIGFILCLVLLIRPYILWLFTAASMRADLNLMGIFYQQKSQFFIALGLASVSLVIFFMYILRRPNAAQWPRFIWPYTRWILIANVLADLAWLSWQAKTSYYQFSIGLALQGVLLLWALLYLAKSRYLTIYFNEWPQVEEEKSE